MFWVPGVWAISHHLSIGDWVATWPTVSDPENFDLMGYHLFLVGCIDGLYKRFLEARIENFPFLDGGFPKKEILMAYVSISGG